MEQPSTYPNNPNPLVTLRIHFGPISMLFNGAIEDLDYLSERTCRYGNGWDNNCSKIY